MNNRMFFRMGNFKAWDRFFDSVLWDSEYFDFYQIDSFMGIFNVVDLINSNRYYKVTNNETN